ncbi:hypothetical protein KFL_004770070 [Klebsormidium nitens]|uniref:MYCBP-associated protein n=1 Tax=Klebsormidium nitens TaxID=105231 RepID=A0A1Y1IDK4_KLENI|nr:hypothetical protein KFL_004770070 [Klebsormidium nitens]|eukprot:GAQ89000.1 hypothetical protein KFL_004770070 [Klebsormidium nitens]
MADPTLFALAPVQLPAISGLKAKTKKVIVVRRTTRPSENGESTSSSVPTLPIIKQRESWTERAYSTSPISEWRDTAAQQATSSRTELGQLPSLGASADHFLVADVSSQRSAERDVSQDANPDEFGALILANTARIKQESLQESSSQSDAAAQLANESSELTSGSDIREDYPPEIAAAIQASEDGGAAIKEAYERRRQHRRELAMQASLLHQQQQEEEEHLLASQTIVAGAEARAFGKWQEAQDEWAKVKRSVMAQTGKPESELVMERGPEFRTLKEAKDHLEAAKPTEEKFSGPAMWEMSLRNHWTISYPVGNIFGRVFAPPCSARPKELERIGRPETEANGTEKGLGTGTRSRSWLESETVKQRQHKLRKEMLKLQPYEPEIDGLQVVGYSIEAGLSAAAAAPITLKEVEKELAASDNHAYTQLLEERARAPAAATSALPAALEETPGQSGPALEMAAGRVTLCAAAGAVATEVLEVSNTGSTVLFYRWEREGDAAAAGPTGKSAEGLGRFYQMDMEGALRPGERKGFAFSFRSREPGTWLDSWRLVTEPRVTSATESLILKGIAFETETPSRAASRSEVEADLATRVRARAVEEAIQALVDGVQTPNPRGAEAPEDPEEVAREMDFVRANLGSGEPLYFRPDARASAICDAVIAIEDRASEAAEGQTEEGASTSKRRWDGSVNRLNERLTALGTAGGAEGLRQRFGELNEKLKVPPNRRALLRRAVYLALTSAADTIVDGVETAREGDARGEADAAAAEGPGDGARGESEEAGAELADAELDEEVLRARAEAKERAFREEAVRQATNRAAEALDGLEWNLEIADAAVCTILDGKVRALLEKTESSQADRASLDWEVFALERQKQRLLHG